MSLEDIRDKIILIAIKELEILNRTLDLKSRILEDGTNKLGFDAFIIFQDSFVKGLEKEFGIEIEKLYYSSNCRNGIIEILFRTIEHWVMLVSYLLKSKEEKLK